MTYVITQSCCNDASCVDVCPVDCIHPAPDDPGFATAEMLYIDPGECIDCGACVPVCPTAAIYTDFELPDHLGEYEKINADYFSWVGDIPAPAPPPDPGPRVTEQDVPLRVAIVGSGPAGWFLSEALTETRVADVETTVLDQLATPHGLVRHGVAPDHLTTKGSTDMFDTLARHRRTTLRLNVEVGRDVSHHDLLQHHHAVVYATGAPEGRTLGIPGEDLRGSHSAADLVGWYNGHPDHVDLDPPLTGERAVVIGNGNVALDIARVLLADPDVLRDASDMSPHALAALTASGIREVVLVGRRGPEHAAFTTPELLSLVSHPDIDVVVDPDDLDPLTDVEDGDRTAATYAAHQKASLLRRAAQAQTGAARRLVLRFGLTPQEVLGDEQVSALVLARTGEPKETETLEAALVLRATGHRSIPVGEVPFDTEAGRFTHDAGRVLDPRSGEPVPATYTTGWAKRGSTGVIGTNRTCAAETAATLLDDYRAGRLPDPEGDAASFDALLRERSTTFVDLAGWRRLDGHERAEGEAAGRPRVKVSDPEEQVRIAIGP
ncbi:4Fe-4S binding protein [Aeromicrobium sp. CTD01-1L150]|uniref:4Fe-4S binding protein n=1 Tax=Aeromicrobium sp. CTD01-1L150 TaxID=3341830 RepID=UPI0035BFEDEE